MTEPRHAPVDAYLLASGPLINHLRPPADDRLIRLALDDRARHPGIVRRWLDQRAERHAICPPHPGHSAVAATVLIRSEAALHAAPELTGGMT